MRILIINSEYPPIGGGAGNAAAHLAAELARLGHAVTVLTAHFGALPRAENRHGVRVLRIPALRRRADRSNAREQLAFIFSGLGWSVRLSRAARPDVTIAFFGMPSGAIAWLMKRLYGIPYLVSLRGGDVPGFRPYDFRLYHRLIAPFLRPIWREAQAVVANSRGLRDLAQAFEPSLPIYIIPNGVDVERYLCPDHAWEPPRLLSVGRVVYQKGLDLGLRALADLADLPWEWRIAGDGPYLETLRAQAADLGIAPRVRFLGWQNREALLAQYCQANLFLFPSRHEGMPNAVLEAMACGLPVIATRIAGNEELVEDGVTGLLTPPEDVDALREALRRLLVQKALRERMGHASRLRVAEAFTWDRVAARYVALIQETR